MVGARMKVLIACEYSGTVRDAFAKLGHDAWSCDILPTDKPGNHYQCDVFDVINNGWDLMIAHPPCTYLSNAGIGWFNEDKYGDKARKRKLDREKALLFFKALMDCRIERICCENPVGYVNSMYRKPCQIIQPYYFGDNERKRTCLWLKGLPLLKETNNIGPPKPDFISYDGKARYFTDSLPQTDDRWKIRSKTFNGVADAMSSQWSNLN
jgi:hypothetical protein